MQGGKTQDLTPRVHSGVPIPRHDPVATGAAAPQPEGPHDMGADDENSRGLAADNPSPSPLAR
jgi:hypothetical protein